MASLPPIESLGQLRKARIEAPCPILEGMLERGSKLMVVGGSKANKSWLLIALALCVSQGRDSWLGSRVTKGKVLYLNFELHRFFFRDRLEQILKAYKIEAVDEESLDVWNLRGQGQDYNLIIKEIKARIGKGQYVLVIIDPIYKFYAEKTVENAADGIAKLLNAIESVAFECDVAIAYAHHTPKGDMSERDVVDLGAGSGVFGRDPDAIISVLKVKGTKNRFKGDFVLRYHPPKPPVDLLFTFPLMETTTPLVPEKTRGRPGKLDCESLLGLLNGKPVTDKAWKEAAKAKFDITDKTYRNYKQKLLISGMVVKNPDETYETNRLTVTLENDLQT